MIGSRKIAFWLPPMASVMLALLFLYAATSKLLDFQQFRVQLGQSPILTAYADWVAWSIPLLEYVLALLLLFDLYRLLALYGAFGLMVMFTTYILLVLHFSDYVPCSCGGVLEDLGWTEHVVFNLFFMVLAILAIVLLETGKTQKTNV
ncbi:MauE/DoxX family redox-associated membrane protein [Flagellimonas marina]|uniref:MauE/DoxX family redox-associated membrane protein n=1 Tax=Flagellimonas marina TaxID=1775168 RepID=A0ABV8PIL1_9FLAO